MTNYYYTHNPDIVHDEKQWNFEIFNHQFKFTTDNGVFSKRTVDYGSRTLPIYRMGRFLIWGPATGQSGWR